MKPGAMPNARQGGGTSQAAAAASLMRRVPAVTGDGKKT